MGIWKTHAVLPTRDEEKEFKEVGPKILLKNNYFVNRD